jgi:hypothetical protein
MRNVLRVTQVESPVNKTRAALEASRAVQETIGRRWSNAGDSAIEHTE